jgi:hypothetical protein
MRPISFVSLYNILRLPAVANMITAKELDAAILHSDVLRTRAGGVPSRTTLYHYRNSMLRLGILVRRDRWLQINSTAPSVAVLLFGPDDRLTELTPAARQALASLVIANLDCRRAFFDLFMPVSAYRLGEFKRTGLAVYWRRSPTDAGSTVVLQRQSLQGRLELRSPNEIKGVLYGIRYWARDELRLIDEYYREDRGAVMYPIDVDSAGRDSQVIASEVLELLDGPNDNWTTLAVAHLIEVCCEQRHRPVTLLFRALRNLASSFPDRLLLIPTSMALAVMGARSRQREDFVLRSYFQDSLGRFISHVRLHNSLRECAYAI